MQHNSNALIVVAKRPAAGKTKTRLSPPLTPELASVLYESFLFDTLDQVRQVADSHHVIAYLDERDYFKRLAPDFELIPQEGHDLGERLDNALTFYLSRGYERAVIMDSDSPTLPASYLSQAFQVLSSDTDVVLGPCDDGGYYLIGLKKPTPRLLREVHMSTPAVATETIALAKAEGLSLVTLPTWYDIDDLASLARLIKEMENHGAASMTHTRRFILQNDIQNFIYISGGHER